MKTLEQIKSEINEIWEKHGRPEQAAGPSTDCGGFSLIRSDDIGDWEGQEENIAASMNEILAELYNMIGCRHIGSGLFVCQYYNNEDYQNYRIAAGSAIDDWNQNYFLEWFQYEIE